MEERRLEQEKSDPESLKSSLRELSDKQLKSILIYGLIISAISIIFSVDYLFREQKYIELGVATGLFASVVILIRWFNGKQ